MHLVEASLKPLSWYRDVPGTQQFDIEVASQVVAELDCRQAVLVNFQGEFMLEFFQSSVCHVVSFQFVARFSGPDRCPSVGCR